MIRETHTAYSYRTAASDSIELSILRNPMADFATVVITSGYAKSLVNGAVTKETLVELSRVIDAALQEWD